jgi:hypothetical protein
MLSLHLDVVRPDPQHCPGLEEHRLLLALAPLRVGVPAVDFWGGEEGWGGRARGGKRAAWLLGKQGSRALLDAL